MKKIFIILLAVAMFFSLAACSTQNNYEDSPRKNNMSSQEEREEVNEEKYVDDDEIIEWDDGDNKPYVEEKAVVEKIINCEGCVYAYFSDEGDKAKALGSTYLLVSIPKTSTI